ncbi:MAG: hypothetical protein AB7Q23_15810 [Hyphomonadaceae bacterium]
MGDLAVLSHAVSGNPPADIFRPPPVVEPPEVQKDPRLRNAWQTLLGRWRGLYDSFHGEACEAWNDYQQSEQQRKRIADEEDRQQPSYWPGWVYALILLFLFSVEVPFNQQAFEYVFLSTRNVSWAVAVIIAAALLVVAHYVGLSIRQLGYSVLRFRDRFMPTGSIAVPVTINLFVISALLLFAAFLIYIVSVFRQGYIALITAANGQRVDVGAVLAQTLDNLALRTPGWMMFAINAGIVVTAIILCMFAHDPNPQFARIDEKAKAAKKKFFNLIKRYDIRVARAEAVFDNQCKAVRDTDELGR